MSERLNAVLKQAVADGLLPEAVWQPELETRPWPVVLLTALGAWLAAIPLLGVVGLLFASLLDSGAGAYVIGLLALAAAVVVLRSKSVPLFVEQLAVPALLVGLGTLGFGLFRDLPLAMAALVLAAINFGLALALRQPWLRVLLGVAMAMLVGFAVLEPQSLFRRSERETLWVAAHLLLVVGLVMPWVQGRWPDPGAAFESLSAGWVLTALVSLAVLSGMTFLVGGAVGGGFIGEVANEVARDVGGRQVFTDWGLPIASALLALLGLALAARAWPSLRHPALAVVALTVVALSWFMPTLGGVVLGLACMASSHRWRLAGAAAVAAAWIVGAFYYALWWPLASKALVLVVAGAAIGAVAWWLLPRRESVPGATAHAPLDRRALAVGVATLATLVVAAGAIWQKQDLIARGQPVFVQLAPVDPRSLMQGDYMRLNFVVPSGALDVPPSSNADRPVAVAQRDARGVAALTRIAKPNEVLAADEFLFQLTPKDGRWVLVSDAWFFREGDAARWEQARFGEFRVLPDGKALLVGMADEKLQVIKLKE